MGQFLANNWVWIAFIGAFVAMHRKGYGCGMHGAHHNHHDHATTSDHAGHDSHQAPAPAAPLSSKGAHHDS